MNIYVMNDIYNNGIFNNSGVAWYPNSGMSNNNTARVVYNGAYLGTNTNAEFAATLTHEFGHWLNLIHTFDGDCIGSNDFVSDTPPCAYSATAYGCHASPTSTGPVSCGGLVNAENYMDYSGAVNGCYKMFTIGQSARMYAALQQPSRQSLWQPSNVVATGLWSLCGTAGLESNSKELIHIYFDNQSNEFKIFKDNEAHTFYTVTDLLGKIIYKGSFSEKEFAISCDNIQHGAYLLAVNKKDEAPSFYKLVK
jgi:hypothetical protein